MSENQTSEQTGDNETLYYLKPEERVDLTNCDREPIHIINHVQPYGALLVLNPDDMTIVQATENARALFGVAAEELQGQGAGRLFVPERVEELRQSVADGSLDASPLYLFSTPLAGQGAFHIIAHVYRGALIVEVEPVAPEDASPDYYSLIKKTLARFEKAATVRDFAQVLCEEVRRISGFDRVMVYRFLEDDSGHVIAEDLAPEQQDHWQPYLGLHYPASDIPKQARALFVLNTVRLIADVGYVPSPLIPAVNPLTGRSCDLSYTFLRGVSSMHTEYLLNMSVHASMSLAIVKDGELWGLVACHHHAPRRVAYDIRTACEFLVRVVSLQITEKEMNEQADYRRRIEEMHHSLVEQMVRKRALLPALADGEPNIMTFVDCGGSAALMEGECRLFGSTPDEAQVRALAEWLAAAHPEEIYATHALPAEHNEAHAFKAVACGALALQTPYGGGGYIFWFRPEVVQTVNWAGDPAKPDKTGPMGDRLTPRQSFALWQETVRDTALAWKPVEIEAARRLRVSVIEFMARLAQELARANQELATSNMELDAFAYIASHDLKEPLRGIHNFSHFLKEDYGDLLPVEGQEQLDTVLKLTRRMEALINSLLDYSRVGQLELAYRECDLNLVLKEVLETLYVRREETGAEIRIPRPLPTVSCDRVQIGAVFHNLINNALKYNDKAEKWVEIGFLDGATEGGVSSYTFYIKDNGIGIEAEQREAIFDIFKRLHGRDLYGGGTGAGLTIARKIVERHKGHLWVESTPGEGSAFYFTLPKEPPKGKKDEK
jgi:chemotaxis family two-component system sensor kinase Cph1